MVSFMEMLLILKNFRENAIKLRRKIKSFRYQPWGPSDNANYGELQRWLSAVSPVLHRISLQAISCPANFHSCPLAAAASSLRFSLRFVWVWFFASMLRGLIFYHRTVWPSILLFQLQSHSSPIDFPSLYQIFKIGYQLCEANGWLSFSTLFCKLNVFGSISLPFRSKLCNLYSPLTTVHFSFCPCRFSGIHDMLMTFFTNEPESRRPNLCLNWVKYGTSFLLDMSNGYFASSSLGQLLVIWLMRYASVWEWGKHDC